jgi:uncharacterized OB-fold protein
MPDPGSRPLPELRDAGRMYWTSAANGVLVVPECEACGCVFWHPRPQCPHCGSDRVGWKECAGSGTIHTFTVVRQASDAWFRERVPYVVAMVDLDEGVRIMTNIVGAGAADAKIGTRVSVRFDVHGDVGIPVFEVDPVASR